MRIQFADSLQPSALSADGRYLLQRVDGLNGFQLADVERGSTTATIEHAKPLARIYLPSMKERHGTKSMTKSWFPCVHCIGVEIGATAGSLPADAPPPMERAACRSAAAR